MGKVARQTEARNDGVAVEELGDYIRENKEAIAQPISDIFEGILSECSYGFRPGRSCHDAIRQALNYLNDGYEWVVDIDIEQFFDRVNHDKLIQILREQVNDSTTLNLIRKYLKAGVMEKGLEKALLLVRRLNATSGFYNCGNEKRFVYIDTTTGLISNFHSQTPFVNDKKSLTELPHN